MQAPTHTDTGRILNHFYHFTVCLCQGELSPQIEEDMLQYDPFFNLDFYFLIYFLEMTLKKTTVFVCCNVFPSSVKITISSIV